MRDAFVVNRALVMLSTVGSMFASTALSSHVSRFKDRFAYGLQHEQDHCTFFDYDFDTWDNGHGLPATVLLTVLYQGCQAMKVLVNVDFSLCDPLIT